MKKIYTTPSVKEIALRCDSILETGSPTVDPNKEHGKQYSKDDDFGKDFGW